MYYVYVLKSLKDNELYIGFSDNLKERFKEHTKGYVASTKERRPLKLVYYESYDSEKDARTREVKLKQHKNSFKELKKRMNNSLIRT